MALTPLDLLENLLASDYDWEDKIEALDYASVKELDLRLTGLLALVHEARKRFHSQASGFEPVDSSLDLSWLAEPLPEVYIKTDGSKVEVTVSDPDAARAALIASNRVLFHTTNPSPAEAAELNSALRAKMRKEKAE